MIAAEQFECHPSGPNAAKESVLYCVGTAPDNYLVMGDVATWVTAIGTLLLFGGAWLAWRAASKTLRQMEKDGADAQKRHEESIRLQNDVEFDRIRNRALFELLGIYSELDEVAGSNRDAIVSVAHRIKVAEQRFVMVNQFVSYPIGLSDYHDALLGAAYSSCDPSYRENGALSAYRRISGAKQRAFRDFYAGNLGPEELVKHLRGIVESMVPEEPYFYPQHLIDDYV